MRNDPAGMKPVAALLAFIALAACAPREPKAAAPAPEPAPPYNTQIDVAELMVHVMDPSARAFWRGWGETLTSKGWTDISPQTDEEWKKVEDGAAAIVTTTNVLLLPDYARKPTADWNRFAEDVAKLAIAGKEGAERKDKQAMYELGGKLDEACDACHHVFAQGVESNGG